MTNFSFSEMKKNWTQILKGVIHQSKRVVLTRKGKKIVAIISIEDLETLQAIEDYIEWDDARKALADVKKNGVISLDTIKHKFK